ncbi:MAG: hypothetical protein CMB73_06675 [Euryarchaeota archaeon]|nr:hypothetical protein [Euryarchaeota archaeon]|tara:strand:+ start:223 stop:1521 length:1299 start_codon:yes stop_codon:yes gene_type:complete
MENDSKVDLREFEGSYLELFLASGIVFLLFVFAVLWQATNYFEYWETNDFAKPLFLFFVMSTYGWLLLNALGCAYTLLPIIHQTQFFRKKDLRVQMSFCMAGHVFITFALLQRNIDYVTVAGLIGLILNAIGLASLSIPTFRVSRRKLKNFDQLGKVAYSLGIIMPIFGIIPIICWILVYGKTSLEVSMYIISTFMIGLVNLTFLVSHFERRLGWDLIRDGNTIRVFKIYLLFTIIGITGTIFSTFFEAIPEYLVRLSQALPFFWMFYAFNPSKVLSNIRKKYPVSKPILVGYFILFFNGLVFLIPQQNVTDFSITFQPWIFLISSALLINIGYGSYMNDDHLHLSLQSRSNHRLFIYSVVASKTLLFYLLFTYNFETSINFFLTIIWIISLVIVIFVTSQMLYKNLGVGSEGRKWSSTPMFYTKYQIKREE